jgi:hypothetical protein
VPTVTLEVVAVASGDALGDGDRSDRCGGGGGGEGDRITLALETVDIPAAAGGVRGPAVNPRGDGASRSKERGGGGASADEAAEAVEAVAVVAAVSLAAGA